MASKLSEQRANSIEHCLWMGKDDGRWLKLCDDITGIKREIKGHSDEGEKFNLSLNVSDEELMSENADLIMLEIKANYGAYSNSCGAFRVFGHSLTK